MTAPDGSVLELGTIASGGEGGASTSATVPFSGNGVYTVTVSAWGCDDRGRPDVAESERAGTDRGVVRQRAGETEVAAPLQPPPPEEEAPPSAEPPVQPGVGQPECPAPSEEPEPEPAEPAPAGEAEPDAEAEPAATADSECEPPQQPVPEPVP